MSEELNNELSTSMVDAGNSVFPQDNTPAEEEIAKVEEPVKVEEPEMNRAIHGSTLESAPESTQDNAITTPRYERSSNEVQGVGPVANGAIGVTSSVPEPKKTSSKPSKKKDTVALFSTKNVTWNGVGKVYRGYNIVDADAAEKWKTRDHIRVATPEEVAKEFGK